MKILNFFITRIFFKRPIFVFSMIALLFVSNYLSFTAARSIALTYQGYKEIETVNKDGNFIANLDPNSDSDFDNIELTDTQIIYDYLEKNYDYAVHVDGFVTSLPSKTKMEISLNYLNEESYKLNHFELIQGDALNFNYDRKKDKIPVLIGFGLSEEFPIGSTIEINDSVSNDPITLKVTGILAKNTHRSNFYAPNSKSYFNFSIFIPINEEFIRNSNLDLQVNGLMDIVLLNSTKEKAINLSSYIQDKVGLKFNFFSQQENFEYFEDYYTNSLKIISAITLITLIVLTILAIWNTLMSIRLMIKEFTINLLVGLSYTMLRKIFYSYFGILFSFNVIIVWAITAINRKQSWLTKDANFATYGVFGLIDMDWIALLIVVVIDIIICIVLVEALIKRIKKIPISLGVLQ